MDEGKCYFHNVNNNISFIKWIILYHIRMEEKSHGSQAN